jgi:ketosteroid isomerase-like protein
LALPALRASGRTGITDVAAFSRGDIEGLQVLFADDAEVQGVLGAGPMKEALAVWKPLVEGRSINFTVEERIAEGDCVAVRVSERGLFPPILRP